MSTDQLLAVHDWPASQAALGAEVEIPTLDGSKVRYKITEGTQPGTVFRLKGKGVKQLNRDKYGDLYIKAIVEIPKKLTDKQKDLLKTFAHETGENINPEEKGFLKKVKNLFGV